MQPCKTLNFLGIKLWLSVQQADALTAGPTCFLDFIVLSRYVFTLNLPNP